MGSNKVGVTMYPSIGSSGYSSADSSSSSSMVGMVYKDLSFLSLEAPENWTLEETLKFRRKGASARNGIIAIDLNERLSEGEEEDEEEEVRQGSNGGRGLMMIRTKVEESSHCNNNSNSNNSCNNSNHNSNKMCARGHWRPAEDTKLKELVAIYGPQNWNLIAEKLEGRSGQKII